MKKFLIFVFAALLSADNMLADSHEPYSGSRIFWDMASCKQVFKYCLYARMIQLQSGRLLAVSHDGSTIVFSHSDSHGKYWTTQESFFSPPSNFHYYDAELTQLADGKIVLSYNIGPSTTVNPGHYGVRVRISEDDGESWGSEINVNDAGGTVGGAGCWEPSVLELPSGELHLYFSNEKPYATIGAQCIQVQRSFDKGQTWSTPQTISYRTNHRDGMPVPIIVGDSIVVVIEDNGWPGAESFVPVTLRCAIADDWNNGVIGDTSPYRNQIIDYNYCPQAFGGAPYLRKLPWGETLLSRQAYYESGDYSNMKQYVYVGDAEARNFKAMSQPFADGSVSVEWNSISVIDSDVVVAVGGVGANNVSNHHVDMVFGYPLKQFTAHKATPTVDGTLNTGEYGQGQPRQVLMGTESMGRQIYGDYAYSADSLYFGLRVNDNTRSRNGSNQDGVNLYIDSKNVSDTKPQNGIYRLYITAAGKLVFYYGESNRWKVLSNPPVHYVVNDDSTKYVVEVAIPWTALGWDKAPVGERLATAVTVNDYNGTNYVTEKMPDVKPDQSWTYMTLRLEEGNETAIRAIDQQTQKVSIHGRHLTVLNGLRATTLTIVSPDGKLIYQSHPAASVIELPQQSKGLYIVRLQLSDGTAFKTKYIVR